jgi:hypothetical protein
MHHHAVLAHQEGVVVGDFEIGGLHEAVAQRGGADRGAATVGGDQAIAGFQIKRVYPFQRALAAHDVLEMGEPGMVGGDTMKKPVGVLWLCVRRTRQITKHFIL